MKVYMPYGFKGLKDYVFKVNVRNFIFLGVYFQVGLVPFLQIVVCLIL